jgi:hypothetical protein
LGLKFSEEDLISYALFPQVALEFFARRDRAERPLEEIAALAAVVADLLGVQEETCVAPEVAATSANLVIGDEAQSATAVRACPYATPGSAWAAAGRQDLIAGRAVSWRY